MQKILLLTAGLGALVAIVAGFAGISTLIGIGGAAMVISLILLPWLKETEPAPRRDRADHGS